MTVDPEIDHNHPVAAKEALPAVVRDGSDTDDSLDTIGPSDSEDAPEWDDLLLEGTIEEDVEGGSRQPAGWSPRGSPSALVDESGDVLLEGEFEDAPQASPAPRRRNVEMFPCLYYAQRPMVQMVHWQPVQQYYRPVYTPPAPLYSPPVTHRDERLFAAAAPTPRMVATPRPFAPSVSPVPLSARGAPSPSPSPSCPSIGASPPITRPPLPPPAPLEWVTKYEYRFESRRWVSTRLGVRIDPRRFGEGTNRNAHHMVDDAGRRWVAKAHRSPASKDVVFREVAMQGLCHYFARAYNTRRPPKDVTFLDAFVIRRTGGQYMACEEYLTGQFNKYNNNGGWCDDDRNTPHAFSHFTYVIAKGKCLVVDIQGVGDVYTDPQIHTVNRTFGDGDGGLDGMRRFFATHRCNPICAALGLAPYAQKVSGTQVKSNV